MTGGRIAHHTPGRGDAPDAFGLAYHLEMVSDTERVRQIGRAMDAVLRPEHVFCELGCGTGIFTVRAAATCRRVYAVEKDPHVLAIARRNVEASGLADRITLIEGEALSARLPERADVVLCEMMSIWLAEEPEVPVLNHARDSILRPGGVTLPQRVLNLVELCNRDYSFGGVEIRAPMPQFAGVLQPRVMSPSVLFQAWEFDVRVPEEVDHAVEVPVLVDGVVNCARLSSIVSLGGGVNFFSTDSLMPVTTVPLVDPLPVRAGERVRFRAKLRCHRPLGEALFLAERA